MIFKENEMNYPMTLEEYRKAVSEVISKDLKISPDKLNKILDDNKDILENRYKDECAVFDGTMPGYAASESKKAFNDAAIDTAAYNIEMLY